MINIDPSNYYEVQLHHINNIDKLNLKPERYKQIMKDLNNEI